MTSEAPILVAVDFSRDSARAVSWAAHQAELEDAPLTLLHVIHDHPDSPGFYTEPGSGASRPIEERAKETELRVKLVAAGVVSPKHQAFLLSEFMGTEDAPEIDEWITTASASDDYAPFFGKGNPAPKAPMATSAAQGANQKTVDPSDPKLSQAERKQALADRVAAFKAGNWKPE